jgi:hypothetical protein
MSRICTAYMKQRTQEAYIRSLGIDSFDSFVGLRADEPERVHRIRARDTQDKIFRCPLFDSGINEKDVRTFWSEQEFDLQLEAYQGNCTACFLKDQSDLSRVLGENETEASWWIELEDSFPGFGGQRFPGFRQLHLERGSRLSIEASLRADVQPVSDGTLDPRRFHLVVLQEKRRLAGERTTFSCNCEAADAIDEEASIS